MTKEERKGKKIRVQFDVTLSIKPQNTMQQFIYLIYSRSYLALQFIN